MPAFSSPLSRRAVAWAGPVVVLVGCVLFSFPLRQNLALAALCFGALLVGYALLLSRPPSARTLLVLFVVSRLLASAAPPQFSDDHHRYIHEARATRLGLAVPYASAPAEMAQPPPPDDGTSARVNHPEISAAYPPTSQWLLWAFVGLGDAMSHPLAGLKLLMLLCDALLLWLLWTRRSRDAACAYAFHPLILLEVPLGAHLDVIGALLVTVAVLASVSPWRRGAFVGLAMGIKPTALLALLVTRLRPRPLIVAATAAVAVALLTTLPHQVAGAPLSKGLVEYGTRWEAHPTVYRVVNAGVADGFSRLHEAGRYTHLHIGGGLLLEQSGRPLVSVGQLHPHARTILVDDRLIARGLAAGLFLLLLAALTRLAPAARATWALWSVFLFLPTFHPWYGVWALPLAAAGGQRHILAAAALLPLFYADDVFGLALPTAWLVLALSAWGLVAAYAAGAANAGRGRTAIND